MDENEIINTIQLTLNPEYTKEAEKKLAAAKNQPNFTSVLLKIIECETIYEQVRHSASILFKNIVKERWAHEDNEREFHRQRPIKENDLLLADKQFIELNLLTLILKTRIILIRDMLLECLTIVLKRSYPVFFSQLLPQLTEFLVSREDILLSGLHILLATLRSQDYKGEERIDFVLRQMPLNNFLARVIQQYGPQDSLEACGVQIVTFKIINHLIKKQRFLFFMGEQALTIVIDASMRLFIRPTPANVPPDEGSPSVWSKSRKWAIRIFCELVKTRRPSKETRDFTKWFIDRHSNDLINCIFTLFSQVTQNIVVSDYVLQYAIMFLRFCITKLSTWNVVSTHLSDIVRQIFIRLLSYTEKLVDLESNDPQTFVEDYCVDDYMLYPESAICGFLSSLAKHRPEAMSLVVNICMQLLADCPEPQKYGAFSVLGFMSRSLVKNEVYKNDMEKLFVAHVFPSMKSANPLIRYKAYWLLEALLKVPFRNRQNELFVAEMIVAGVINDSSLPVQYQAVLLFDTFMGCFEEQVLNILIPYIKPLTMKMMGIVKELNCQRTPFVLEKMFDVYSEHIAHVAVDVVQGSSQLIASLLSSSTVADSIPTISGLVTAVDTVVNSLDNNLAILAQVEPHVDEILKLCFNDEIIKEMWDDFSMLLSTITTHRVNPIFWKYFYRFCDVFPSNSELCSFEEMMDFVHNFITVDINTFLQQPDALTRLMGVVNLAIASSIPGDENDEQDVKVLALKVYEILLISSKGKLSQERLSFILTAIFSIYNVPNLDNGVLKYSCLMSFISAIYCDYSQAVALLSSGVVNQISLISDVLDKWIRFVGSEKCNRHQMKLSLLVITEFINSPDTLARSYAQGLMPLAVSLCLALQKDYENPKKDEDEEYLEDYDESSSLASVEYNANNPIEVMDETVEEDESYDEDDDEDDAYYDEVYTTLIDSKGFEKYELIVFGDTIKGLQERDVQYFYSLFGRLDAGQQQSLRVLCEHVAQLKANQNAQR